MTCVQFLVGARILLSLSPYPDQLWVLPV